MMLQSLLRPSPAADVRDHLVIAPHHPDRLKRPPARLGAIEDERFQQTLTWNVFRTLELITPAFWLRRLHIRLTGDQSAATPQIVTVSLWRPLPLPPIQRIDGARADVIADIAIETEHTVWTLIVADGRDHSTDDLDQVAHLVDAGAWLAGAREYFCGVIEATTASASLGGMLKRRYSRSRDSARLRSDTRRPAAPTLTACGALNWRDLAAILHQCQAADGLSAIERALAHNALVWLQNVGVEPTTA